MGLGTPNDPITSPQPPLSPPPPHDPHYSPLSSSLTPHFPSPRAPITPSGPPITPRHPHNPPMSPPRTPPGGHSLLAPPQAALEADVRLRPAVHQPHGEGRGMGGGHSIQGGSRPPPRNRGGPSGLGGGTVGVGAAAQHLQHQRLFGAPSWDPHPGAVPPPAKPLPHLWGGRAQIGGQTLSPPLNYTPPLTPTIPSCRSPIPPITPPRPL